MIGLRKKLVLAFTGLAFFACSEDSSNDAKVADAAMDATVAPDAAAPTEASTPADAATPDAATLMDASANGDGGTSPNNAVSDAAAGTDATVEYTYPNGDGSWAEGPHGAVTLEETGPNNVYTLYHPEDFAPAGELNPIIIWGNGGGTTPALYTMLPHLATHGFVVIAANSTMVTSADLIAGIDWLLEQNEDDTSDFYQQLDPAKIGAMGYSNGSLAVYSMLEDPNKPDLVTTVHVSGGVWVDNPHDAVLLEPGPTAYFCDATPVADSGTKENCDTDYDVVEVPVFYGSLLDGAIHISIPFEPYSVRVAGAATAWFRWHLMGEEQLESVFLGEDCEICQDPAWSVQRKNWN